MTWLKKLKSRHWDEAPPKVTSGDGWINLGSVTVPPLRRAARALKVWALKQINDHAASWVAAIGTLAAAYIALIAYLRQIG